MSLYSETTSLAATVGVGGALVGPVVVVVVVVALVNCVTFTNSGMVVEVPISKLPDKTAGKVVEVAVVFAVKLPSVWLTVKA